MNATASKTSFFLRPTGTLRTIEPEFGKAFTLPEVELVRRERMSDSDSFSGVAEVEGHGLFYLWQDMHAYDGHQAAVLLTRTLNAYDAGHNLQRSITAPESSAGISAPVGRGPTLFKVHGDPIFAAVPGDYTDILEN